MLWPKFVNKNCSLLIFRSLNATQNVRKFQKRWKSKTFLKRRSTVIGIAIRVLHLQKGPILAVKSALSNRNRPQVEKLATDEEKIWQVLRSRKTQATHSWLICFSKMIKRAETGKIKPLLPLRQNPTLEEDLRQNNVRDLNSVAAHSVKWRVKVELLMLLLSKLAEVQQWIGSSRRVTLIRTSIETWSLTLNSPRRWLKPQTII